MYKCRKYKLQRIAVTIAAILWIVTAVRSFMERSIYAVNNTGSDIVSIFSENVDNNVQSDISVDTELSDNYLSEQAMCLILEKMASEIGINRYNIQYSGNNSYENVYNNRYISRECVLTQDSLYGTVVMGIKATDEDKNYISIHIKLGKGVTSITAYKAKLEKICNIYGIDSNVNVCITGQCDGDKSIEERNQITGNILSQLGAKEAEASRTKDLYTIYAYDKDTDGYMYIGKKKTNINISMNYDETTDKTNIYLATPINRGDY